MQIPVRLHSGEPTLRINDSLKQARNGTRNNSAETRIAELVCSARRFGGCHRCCSRGLRLLSSQQPGRRQRIWCWVEPILTTNPAPRRPPHGESIATPSAQERSRGACARTPTNMGRPVQQLQLLSSGASYSSRQTTNAPGLRQISAPCPPESTPYLNRSGPQSHSPPQVQLGRRVSLRPRRVTCGRFSWRRGGAPLCCSMDASLARPVPIHVPSQSTTFIRFDPWFKIQHALSHRGRLGVERGPGHLRRAT